MGRLLRALMLLIGVLALVAGIAGAAYVGPDDRVWLKTAAVESKAGQPVITSPELTSYRDLHLLVRASAPGGVFLGAGNPIDVGDLAAQVDHYEVTGIRRSGVLGGQRAATAEQPVELPAPASLQDWYVHQEGEGVQQVDLDLTGTPTQVFVQPLSKQSPSLRFGIELNGLFLALLGLAVLGAVLLAVAIWRMNRAKRAGSGGTSADAPLTDPPTDSPGHDAAKVGAALSVVAVLATGCGWVPEQVDPPKPTKVALEEDDVAAMLADVDVRMNKAIKAADGPKYDVLKWRDVDAGPAYDDDVYTTRLRAAVEKNDPTPRVSHEPVETYSPAFTRYPMWTVTVSKTTGGQATTGVRSKKEQKEYDKAQAKAQRKDVTLELYERTSAASSWMRQITADLAAKDVPSPAATPSPATTGDRKLAAQVVAGALANARNEKPAIKVEFSPKAEEFRKSRLRFLRGSDDYFRTATLSPIDLGDEADGLRMVAVEGGHLAVAVRKIRYSWGLQPGKDVTWNTDFEVVNGSTSTSLYQDMNLVIVAMIPDDDATPRVLTMDDLSDIS